MDVKEVFKNYPQVIKYIDDNEIRSANDFTFSDCLMVSRLYDLNYKEIFDLYKEISKYKFNCKKENSVKSLNIDFLLNKDSIEEKVLSIKTKKNIKSKWFRLDEYIYKDSKYTYRDIIIHYYNYKSDKCSSFNEYLSRHKVVIDYVICKSVINEYILSLSNSCKKEIEVLYLLKDYVGLEKWHEDSISFIINKRLRNMYISPLVPFSLSKMFHEKRIVLIDDLIKNGIYFDRSELISIMSKEIDAFINVDSQIDRSFKNSVTNIDVIIAMMKVKGYSYNRIKEMTKYSYKDFLNSYYNVLDKLKEFFDSFNGIVIIKYLLMQNDGFFTIADIKKLMPKYYLLFIDLVSNNILYKINYSKEYDVFTQYPLNDSFIIDNSMKLLCEDEYMNLFRTIYTHFSDSKVYLTENIIRRRLDKIYVLNHGRHYKGYISKQMILCEVYLEYYKDGISRYDINSFYDKCYELFNIKVVLKDNLYSYFISEGGKYYLRNEIISKYKKSIRSTKISSAESKRRINHQNLIIRLCEEYNTYVDVRDISKISEIKIDRIKKVLNNSRMYYQLSNILFIKSDDLMIDDYSLSMLKHIGNGSTFSFLDAKCKDFLRRYNIKSKKILCSLIKKYMQYNN